MNLEWNVFRMNLQKRQIETFNIFDHGRFRKTTIERLKECSTKEDFEYEFKRLVFYHYAWKFEYETCIGSIISSEANKKIDIRNQLQLNWNRLVDYLWGNKEEILRGL